MSDDTVHFVLSSEITQLFGQLGVKDAFEAGELHCFVTGEVITLENFRAVFRSEGELRFLSRTGLPQLVSPVELEIDVNGDR